VLVQVPNGPVIYAVIGLVIFAGLVAYDLERLRRTKDIRTTPLHTAALRAVNRSPDMNRRWNAELPDDQTLVLKRSGKPIF
jgi:hypothetical protein